MVNKTSEGLPPRWPRHAPAVKSISKLTHYQGASYALLRGRIVLVAPVRQPLDHPHQLSGLQGVVVGLTE